MRSDARRSVLLLVSLALALATPIAASTPTPASPSARYLVLALLEPERIAVVNLATGQVAERPLPGGTLCRSLLHVTGDRVVYLRPGRPLAHVMAVDLALRERPRSIGRTDVMVPSTERGRLWLGIRTKRDRLRVREVWVPSRNAARPRHTVPNEPLLGAVPDGLVLGGQRSIAIWDPRTGRFVRATPGPFLIATHGARIASCGGSCTTLLVAGGGRGRTIHSPSGTRFLPTAGSFSPDGRLVALPIRSRPHPRLALVDVEEGTSRIVPGVRLGPRGALAWAPAGRELYMSDLRGRILRYRPGAARPEPVGLRFEDPIVQLLVAG